MRDPDTGLTGNTHGSSRVHNDRAVHVGETFQDERVELDHHIYERCTFVGCEFIYRGETPARLADCRVEDAELTLEGPAGQTIDFLTAMYQAGFKPHVMGALRNIRRGAHPS